MAKEIDDIEKLELNKTLVGYLKRFVIKDESYSNYIESGCLLNKVCGIRIPLLQTVNSRIKCGQDYSVGNSIMLNRLLDVNIDKGIRLDKKDTEWLKDLIKGIKKNDFVYKDSKFYMIDEYEHEWTYSKSIGDIEFSVDSSWFGTVLEIMTNLDSEGVTLSNHNGNLIIESNQNKVKAIIARKLTWLDRGFKLNDR